MPIQPTANGQISSFFSLRLTVLAVAISVFLSVLNSFAAVQCDTLAGALPKFVKNPGNPYLVVSDIEVPFGKTVTIEPGTVFLFQNFTGFKIQGQLIAEGTQDKPIVFTSEFDGKYLGDPSQIPNPFDWNGIYIHKDGFGTRMRYCEILYTVFGIKSDTRLILLDPGMFKGNGKLNLSIADSIVTVNEGSPLSYNLSARDAVIEGISIKLVEDPLGRKRTLFRAGGLLSFGAGAGVAVYGFIRYIESSEKLEELSTDAPENTHTNKNEDWNDARQSRNGAIAMTGAGALVGVIGALGFTLSFTF